MEKLSIKEIANACCGKIINCMDENICIDSIKSDNRKIEKGDMFAAFVGENTDGHKFVNAAFESGAVCALVSKEPEEKEDGKAYILVDDTIKAVGDIASCYRNKFDIPLVGVTGSVGKTTMKDMIASVLSVKYSVTKTQANFNNNIGLPRTIFTIDKNTSAAVIEMGMNHIKEISYLTNIAKPTYAVITNIGDAHIGNLGSRENIFKAKCEIFEGLKEGGLAVMNADDEYLCSLKDNEELNKKFRFVYVGEAEDADFRAVNIEDDDNGFTHFDMIFGAQTFKITVPARGRHMIYPSLAAAAIAHDMGMSFEDIAMGIRNYVPTAMRMETWKLDGNVVIYNDTYNANPQSMKAGLLTLSNTNINEKIAILGDMFELGAYEEELHRQVGIYARDLQIDKIITIGQRAKFIAAEASQNKDILVESFDDVSVCKDQIIAELKGKKNIAIYLKASHAMGFSKLAEDIKTYTF